MGILTVLHICKGLEIGYRRRCVAKLNESFDANSFLRQLQARTHVQVLTRPQVMCQDGWSAPVKVGQMISRPEGVTIELAEWHDES